MRGLISGIGAAALIACVRAPDEGATAEAAVSVTDAEVTTALHGRLAPLAAEPAPDAKRVLLGKALFWDVQAGGDGKTACATCHFHAGADTRVAFAPGPDGQVTSHAGSNIISDDRVGSFGVPAATFDGRACVPGAAPARQITVRNAPSAIGASVYRELFLDGRAASLAAQARGPILNAVEMSCTGRTFDDLARTLLPARPLAEQQIAPTDGVLGALGARTYADLVADAYGPGASFEDVWGDAIAAYEETLVPNATPLDAYLAGDTTALTSNEKWGLVLFATRGRCIECHDGAALTDASKAYFEAHGPVNGDGGDQGYHNVGVRPVSDLGVEDVGRGAYSVSGGVADRGAFKTPALRNVALTAPYFHNGGKQTLTDVVNAYRGPNWGDYPHTSTVVRTVSLLDFEVPPLVALLEHGLTDPRVEHERAPFDHPSLDVPNGPSLPAIGRAGTRP